MTHECAQRLNYSERQISFPRRETAQQIFQEQCEFIFRSFWKMNDRPLVRKLNAQKLIHVEEFHEGKQQKKS